MILLIDETGAHVAALREALPGTPVRAVATTGDLTPADIAGARHAIVVVPDTAALHSLRRLRAAGVDACYALLPDPGTELVAGAIAFGARLCLTLPLQSSRLHRLLAEGPADALSSAAGDTPGKPASRGNAAPPAAPAEPADIAWADAVRAVADDLADLAGEGHEALSVAEAREGIEKAALRLLELARRLGRPGGGGSP